MFLVFLILIVSLFSAIIYIFKTHQQEKVFQTALLNIKLPTCIINEKGIIEWTNLYFQEEFKNLHNKHQTFEELFNIKNMFNQCFVLENGKIWKLEYFNIDENFGIIFKPARKEPINWWNNLPFPVGILNQNMEIESANLSLQSILGDDYESKTLIELAPEFDLKQAQHINGQELLWHSKVGIIPVTTWVHVYDDKYVLILENKIEFIKLKNKAQEAQHLQIMGQFASSIIHDFNNLLMAISGLSDSLESIIPKNETLNLIKENTHHASNLANELLNFVKNKERESQVCDAAQFLNSRLGMLQKMLGSQIEIEISAKYDGLIELSPTQLEQIILNMAINSKDAMIQSGNKKNKFKITQKKVKFLEKTKIRSAWLEPGAYFAIEISDNGEGIDADNIKKIFSPFFSTKEKGVGLGLASSLQIVQHAGGTIDFSTSNLGTKFIIYLPIKAQVREKEQTKILAQSVETHNQADTDIIFAEDEEVILSLAKKALMQEKYIVSGHSCGQDALNAMKENPKTKVLITDAMLPDIDGITLAQKAQQINKEIKIIIISGYSYDSLWPNIKQQLDNINNVYYLGKPFTLKTLKMKINQIMEK